MVDTLVSNGTAKLASGAVVDRRAVCLYGCLKETRGV